MLKNIDNIITSVISTFAGRIASSQRGEINRWRARYAQKDDQGLREEFDKLRTGWAEEAHGGRGLFGSLTKFTAKPEKRLVRRSVALGAEVFRRAPADLEEGSGLYPEQIQAATAIAYSCAVQMNTGEGKTYAILPAVIAFLCQTEQCFVVCANDYLAERDGRRTQRFWEFLGVSVGVGLGNTHSDEWDRDVIYTTVTALAFRIARSDLAVGGSTFNIRNCSVVVDDADSSMLDQAFESFAIVQNIAPESMDWELAFDVARQLKADEHVEADLLNMEARLTVTGEAFLEDVLVSKGDQRPNYHLLRRAVELAYFAMFCLEQNVHYVVEGRNVYAVNSVTGEIETGRNYDWLMPLRKILNAPQAPKSVSLNRVKPVTIFRDAAKTAGVSGTMRHDGFEYLFSYHMPVVTIRPRFPRQVQRQKDRVLRSRKEAMENIVATVKEGLEQRRPVFVGAQNISDAEAVYSDVLREVGDVAVVNLISGRSDADIARFYREAGEVGTVTITTQLSGRGVDIRISPEARANGGLSLISFGRAQEPRHDRQFEGRAGRHGDPFSIVYILSLEDRLMTMFGAARLEKMLSGLGMQQGEAVEHSWVDKAIKRAQEKIRTRNFGHRRLSDETSALELLGRKGFRSWFQRTTPKIEGWGPIIEQAVSDFVYQFVQGKLSARGEMSGDQAAQLTTAVRQSLLRDDVGFTEVDLEGAKEDEAMAIVHAGLIRKVNESLTTAKTDLERIHAKLEAKTSEIASERSARRARLLNDVRSMLPVRPLVQDEDEPISEGQGQAAPVGDGLEDLAYHELRAFQEEQITYAPADPEAALIQDAHTYLDSAPEDDPQRQGIAAVLAELESLASLWSKTSDRQASFDALPPEDQARYTALVRRSPVNCGTWALKAQFADYWERVNSSNFFAFQRKQDPLERMRQITDRLEQINEAALGRISQDLLAALLATDQPQTLDDLFFIPENTVDDPTRNSVQVRRYLSANGEARRQKRPDRRELDDDLIEKFLSTQTRVKGKSDLTISRQKKLLRGFLKAAPLSTMTTQEGVARALQTWESTADAHAVRRKEKKENRQVIEAFLNFLADRKFVAPFPQRLVILRTYFRRAVDNMGRDIAAIAAVGSLLAVAVFALLTYVPIAARMPPFPAELALADAAIFGGQFAAASLAAPVIMGAFLGIFVASILGFRRVSGAQLEGAAGLIGVPLSIFSAAAILYFNPPTHTAGYLLQAGLLVVVLLLFQIFRNAELLIRSRTGIPLLSVWIFYSSGFVLATHLAQFTANPSPLFVTIAGGTMLGGLWRWQNEMELPVVSARVDMADGRVDDYKMAQLVQYRHDLSQLIMAVLLALIVGPLLAAIAVDLGWVQVSDWATLVVYGAALLALTHQKLRKELNPAQWATSIGKQRQVFDQGAANQTLGDALGALRRTLFLREVAFQLVLLGALVVTAMMFGFDGAVAGLPIVLVVHFQVLLLSQHGLDFLRRMVGFLFNLSTVVIEADQSKILDEDDDERRGFIAGIFRVVRKSSTLIFLGALAVFDRIVSLVGLYEFAVQYLSGAGPQP